jgi:hypothetical protein
MSDFLREWFRVLSRELILVILIIYFHVTHASETLQASLIAGLLALMNTTRFQWREHNEQQKNNNASQRNKGDERSNGERVEPPAS